MQDQTGRQKRDGRSDSEGHKACKGNLPGLRDQSYPVFAKSEKVKPIEIAEDQYR